MSIYDGMNEHRFEHVLYCVNSIHDIWQCSCGRGFTGESNAHAHSQTYKRTINDSEMVDMQPGKHVISTSSLELSNQGIRFVCSCGMPFRDDNEVNAHLSDLYRLASMIQNDFKQQVREKMESEPITLTVRVRIWIKAKQVRWEIIDNT